MKIEDILIGILVARGVLAILCDIYDFFNGRRRL